MKTGNIEVTGKHISLPVLTTAERDAGTFSESSLIYNTTTKSLNLRMADGWSNTSGTTNANSAVVEGTWATGTVYTKTVSIPGVTPGGSYAVNVALSPDFMQEISSSGGVLVTNAWCLVNGELIISAKVL